MAIQMNVVGVFFGAKLPLTGTQKVIDVLQSAKTNAKAGNIPNVTNFDYEVTTPPHASVTSFSATYSSSFKGRGVMMTYPPGEYFLAEDMGAKPAYSVWQYYVLDADGKPIVRGVKFLDDPAATVPDNGTLIWRLVSILRGPNPRPAIALRRLA